MISFEDCFFKFLASAGEQVNSISVTDPFLPSCARNDPRPVHRSAQTGHHLRFLMMFFKRREWHATCLFLFCGFPIKYLDSNKGHEKKKTE